MKLHKQKFLILLLLSFCFGIETYSQSIVDDIINELKNRSMKVDTIHVDFFNIGKIESDDKKKLLVKIIDKKKAFLNSYCVFNKETNNITYLRSMKSTVGSTRIVSGHFYEDKTVLIYRSLDKEGVQVFDRRGELKFLFEGIIPGEQWIDTRLDRKNNTFILVSEELDRTLNEYSGAVYAVWKYNLKTNMLINIAKVRKSTRQIETSRQIKNIPIITLDVEGKQIKLKKGKEKTEPIYKRNSEFHIQFTQIYPVIKYIETENEMIFEY